MTYHMSYICHAVTDYQQLSLPGYYADGWLYPGARAVLKKISCPGGALLQALPILVVVSTPTKRLHAAKMLFQRAHGSLRLTIVTKAGMGLVAIVVHKLCSRFHVRLGKKRHGREPPIRVSCPHELRLYIC